MNAAPVIALQASEVLGRDDHDFVAAMYRDVLRPFASDFTYQFAETRFGILKQPIPPARFRRWELGLLGRRGICSLTI